MWLKRVVGISLIVACVGMNAIILIGFFAPNNEAARVAVAPLPVATPLPPPVPSVTLTASPAAITAGLSSALNWTTTGNPAACTASGTWTGPKTAFGAESTGRLSKPGNYTYVLSCQNESGTATASATVNVGGVAPVAMAKPTAVAAPAATYCSGRTPCYGARDLASHSAAGNCWGYNIDRVINISTFDVGYHTVKSGISSIEISAVCGKNLGPALSGQVGAGGQPARDHKATSKNNADRNIIPYFVGYYDSTKP